MVRYLIVLIFMFSYLPMANANERIATESSSDSGRHLKRIYEGDMEVGGRANFSYDSLNGLTTSTDLAYRYFFIDRLSLGVIANYTGNKAFDTYGVGLSGAYYFWEYQRWATYFQQDALYQRTRSLFGTSEYMSFNSTLGAKYFITPEVALDFGITKNIGDTGGVNSNVGFSISF